MKYLLSFLSCLLVFVTSSSSILAAADQEHQMQPSSNQTPPVTIVENLKKPLELSTNIVDSQKINDKTKVNGKVSIKLNQKTDKNVSLWYELYSMDENMHVKLVEKKELFNGKVDFNAPANIQSYSLDSLEPGQYQLKIMAQSIQGKDESWGDLKIQYFSVNESGVQEGLNIKKYHILPLENLKTGELYEIDRDGGFTIDDLKKPLQTNTVTESTYSNFTEQYSFPISGNFYYSDRSNNISPWKKGIVVIQELQNLVQWVEVARTITDDNGYFSTSFISSESLPKIRVIITTMNEHGGVGDQQTFVYAWAAQINGFMGGYVGQMLVGANDPNRLAIYSFEDMVRTYDALANYSDPGYSVIIWYPGATGDPHYTLGEYIHLPDAAPLSDDTTIHELAHNYMYNVWGNSFPPSDCPPGDHYFQRESAISCAWSEGWADFLPLYINNDPLYNWSPSEFTNVENRDGSTYESGDKVEGNVAASLWDLYDSVDDGSDTKSYPFSFIYTNMWIQKPKTFQEYWNSWVNTMHYDPNAIVCLNQNTIYY